MLLSYIAFRRAEIGRAGSPSRPHSARPAVAPYHIALQAQSFWNQNAIEQIEKPLHQQRQQGCWNRALQDRCVIVQVETAQDWFAKAAGSD
jgi:predicted CoA-binding protein